MEMNVIMLEWEDVVDWMGGCYRKREPMTCLCSSWMEVPFAEMVKSREGTVLGGWEDIQ